MSTSTERKHPVNEGTGKALVERFSGLKIGQPCVLPTPFPGLSAESAQAVLREKSNDGKFWEFSLFWHGCDLGSVVAEIKDDHLVLDVL